MKLYCLFILSFSLCTSCANFRTTIKDDQREFLTEENIVKLSGNYKRIAKPDSIGADMFWNLFTKGINTRKGAIDYVKLEFKQANKVTVSLFSDTTLLKSKTKRYKIRDGYCVFKRRIFIVPALYLNVFRNTKFRIGVLKNNNLIGDFHEIAYGTGFFIIPFYSSEKEYHKEYERMSP